MAVIADVVGTKTRFRSLEVVGGGHHGKLPAKLGGAASNNPSEPSPIALYARIFGPDFKDPNAADFKPDPLVLARRSVLSYVKDERMSMMRELDASDRARLDEYFTSVRQIEQQLDLEAQKPAPMPACTVPERPPQGMKSLASIDEAAATSKLMGALLAHALSCGCRRAVFSQIVMIGSMGFTQPGTSETWHELTHEEPVDPKLGYQLQVTDFLGHTLQMFAEFLHQLENQREGDGSVLDRVVVLWQSDHGYAATHTMDNLPFLTVLGTGRGCRHQGRICTVMPRRGSACGPSRTHPATGHGEFRSKQLECSSSNETSKTIREILVYSTRLDEASAAMKIQRTALWLHRSFGSRRVYDRRASRQPWPPIADHLRAFRRWRPRAAG